MGILVTQDPLLTSWTMLLKALTLRNVSLIVDFNPIDFCIVAYNLILFSLMLRVL